MPFFCSRLCRTIAILTAALEVRIAIALRGVTGTQKDWEEKGDAHEHLAVDSKPPPSSSDSSGDLEVQALEGKIWTEKEQEEGLDLENLDEFLDEVLAEEVEEEQEEKEEELDFTPEELDEILNYGKDDGDQSPAGFTEEEIDEIVSQMDFDEEVKEEEQDKDQNDVDCTFHSNSPEPLDWLRVAKNFPSTSGCQDFGPRFGRWGAAACPSLNEIIENIESGTKEATGGKSGTKPLVSSKFVVKVIDETEHQMLHKLLHQMKGSRRDSFLVPTCRSLCFEVEDDNVFFTKSMKYVQITPNVLLRGGPKKFSRLFDLKGNYGWRNRLSNAKKDFVWKDKNFKNLFPTGLDLTQVTFPNPGRGVSTMKGDDGKNLFARSLYFDSATLARLGLMDYSLLLHVVLLPGEDTEAEAELEKLNTNKPWALGRSKIRGKDKFFAISIGVIDLLMHQDENRGVLNKFAASFSRCRVSDLDPIPAQPYWMRFLRMFGVQQWYKNSKGGCVSCLDEKAGDGYTYFPSNFVPPRLLSHRYKLCQAKT